MKKILYSLLFVTCFLSYGQQLNYLERFRIVERFGNERQINLSELSPIELADIMRFAGGLNATPLQASEIQNKVRYLDELINSGEDQVAPSQLINLGLSPSQTDTLVRLINENSNDPSPQTFLAASNAQENEIPLIDSKLLDDIKKEAARPARPNSPTNQSLRRVFRRTTKIQKIRMPKPSGDYFSNLSTSLDYSYTEFDDNSLGTYGQFHDWSISMNGTITENTDLSFSFIASESDSSGTLGNEYRGDTYGGDLMLIHKLNDNYGLGTFGFYQHSDYETLDTRDYGSGIGALFTTWHDLGWLELSTINSLTKTYYEAGNDTLFNSSLDLTKYWTDRFSTSLRVMFTDSTDSDTPGDNTYWTLGGSIGYMFTENLFVSLGYASDEAIKDYESETWNVGFTWHF